MIVSMKKEDQKKHNKKKRNLAKRLENSSQVNGNNVFKAEKIYYEISERVEGIHCGGLGAIHMLVKSTGLVKAIDNNMRILKQYRPYHDSDHILNICYNLLAGGEYLEDIKHLRDNPEYLNSMDVDRIPDQQFQYQAWQEILKPIPQSG